jgi:hypothetical protein
MPNCKSLKPIKRITVTANPDDYEAIDRLARRDDVSMSWLSRLSMREFLERHSGDESLDIYSDKEVA